LHASCAINEGSDITKYEGHKNDKKKRTYHGLLVNFVGNNARALEHILSRTGSEAHFHLSGTRILIGTVFSREFALWATCIWRNVAKISRGEGCYKLALRMPGESITVFTLQICVCTYLWKKLLSILLISFNEHHY